MSVSLTCVVVSPSSAEYTLAHTVPPPPAVADGVLVRRLAQELFASCSRELVQAGLDYLSANSY